MCINFIPPSPQQLLLHFGQPALDDSWPQETWQDYLAPVMIDTGSDAFAFLASYGFLPRRHQPPGKTLTTLNARAETVASLRSYRSAWHHGQRCLVPMQAFIEPCYESGRNVWTRIGLASGQPFAVAGLWRDWQEADGSRSYSFTQLTINADQHPLLSRMHKPGEEKRSLAIIPPEHYAAWLREAQPHQALDLLRPYPAAQMVASPAR